MRRSSTLLITLLIFSSKIFAGTGGPDTFGYIWKDSNAPDGPTYDWIDITLFPNVTQVKLLGDDNSRGPFDMNFNFHYYWYDVNQFWVGSNGYIAFQDGQIASLAFGFPTFPTATAPNDVLGACMNDLTFLNANNPGECWYYLNPALDTLIVSWINVPFFDTNGNGYSGSNTFQIILSAVDSSITYQYNSVGAFSPYSGQSSVGIENYSAAVGFGLQWPTAGGQPQTPSNNFAIKFYYPHPPLLADVTDAAVLQNDNPSTGAVFVTTNGYPHTLTTKVRNYSMHTTPPFNVLGEVLAQNGNIEVLEDHSTDSLLQGESEDIMYTSTFTPTLPGNYQFKTYSQLPNDPSTTLNNTKTQVIVAIDSTQNEIWLGYDSVAQVNGGLFTLQWVGGSGGAGNYFIPPFYPVAITKLHYFVTGVGPFSARVYDDDGVLGLPFTVLDSEYISNGNINNWTDITLDSPIIITDGGFYMSWDEQGTGTSLGCNIVTGHASNRSFELFQNIWGIFRWRSDYNPLIAATIEKYSYPTGAPNTDGKQVTLSVFPNPVGDQVSMQYNIADARANNALLITDVQGKLIQTFALGIGAGLHQKNLDVSALPAGIYFVTLSSGKEKVVQKLVITE
ncbi:MAG TPA: T9SS type A sorting domain-containing protein [Chitinophagales bacterium]|nr:T9SS type A sorting domain-containing protein [Chitinophagales bacterium]